MVAFYLQDIPLLLALILHNLSPDPTVRRFPLPVNLNLMKQLILYLIKRFTIYYKWMLAYARVKSLRLNFIILCIRHYKWWNKLHLSISWLTQNLTWSSFMHKSAYWIFFFKTNFPEILTIKTENRKDNLRGRNYFDWQCCERCLLREERRNGRGNQCGVSLEASIPREENSHHWLLLCQRARRGIRPLASCSPAIYEKRRIDTTW